MQSSGCKKGFDSGSFVKANTFADDPSTYFHFEPTSENQKVLFYLQTECNGQTYEIDNYYVSEGQDKGHFADPSGGNCARIFQLVGTAEEDYYKIYRPECGDYRTAIDSYGQA